MQSKIKPKSKLKEELLSYVLDTTSIALLNSGGKTVKLNYKPRQQNKLEMGSSNHTHEGCENQPGLNKEKGTEQAVGRHWEVQDRFHHSGEDLKVKGP